MLIAVALSLAETGPGSPSIDDAIGAKWHGPQWAIRALVGGIIGAICAHVVAERAPAPEPAPDAPATDAAAEPQAEAAAPSN